MPTTDQDSRALAYLAGRIRDEIGGPHWDRLGIEAVTAKLVGKPLAPTVERVARHAADKDARTPGAMLRPFVPTGETTGDRRPTPPKHGQHCDTCGKAIDECLPTCGERRPRPAPKSDYYAEHVQQARELLHKATTPKALMPSATDQEES